MLNRRPRDEVKFEVDSSYLITLGEMDSTFIKVDESGRVIAHGNPIWGRKGQVFLMGIPWISGVALSHTFNFKLTLPITYSNVVIDGEMFVKFSTKAFSYQELYDKIAKDGIDSIGGYLVKNFNLAATVDDNVKEALQYYADSGNPVIFFEKLCVALKHLNFGPGLLSNITSIEVQLELNTVRNLTKVSYRV